MIQKRRQLLNRLEGAVYLDKKDPTIVRIDFESVLMHLYEFGLAVPPKQYEAAVVKFLDAELVNKAPAEVGPMRILVGKLLYDISAQLAVTEEEMLKHKLKLQ